MGPGSLASAAASMRRTIKSIEVVDDLTVRVNTTSPQIGLPASLSRAVAPEGAIMPKAYIEKVGEEEFRKKPVGSGPWKFVRNVPGDRIEFTAVDHAALARPAAFQGPALLLVPEESTRVAMVRTGEAAIASIGPETMLSASRAGLEVLSVPGTMQAIFQFWGTWKPEVKDSADRQAARAPGAVAGDRPQAGDRARHERQGAHALSVRRPSPTPIISAPSAGRSGRPRPIATIPCWPRRSWPRRAIPTASSSSSPTPRCRARSSWSISAPRSPTCGPRSASR